MYEENGKKKYGYKPTRKTTWHDVEEIYNTCGNNIISTAKTVNDILSIHGVKEMIPDKSEVAILVNGLNRDLMAFTERMVAIHEKHKNKKGVIKTADDYADSINILGEYNDLNTQFQAVVLPSVMTIMENVGQAAQRILRENDTKPESSSDDVFSLN